MVFIFSNHKTLSKSKGLQRSTWQLAFCCLGYLILTTIMLLRRDFKYKLPSASPALNNPLIHTHIYRLPV
ncbi:hypothetical protein BDV30DRAFT_215752, partial [Aspergillus minisclerotigenes]